MPDQDKTVEIRVTDFPVEALEELRKLARQSGVPDTNTAILKWGAIQWLISQKAKQVPAATAN